MNQVIETNGKLDPEATRDALLLWRMNFQLLILQKPFQISATHTLWYCQSKAINEVFPCRDYREPLGLLAFDQNGHDL